MAVGGGSTSVCHVLMRGSPVSLPFRGGDLVFPEAVSRNIEGFFVGLLRQIRRQGEVQYKGQDMAEGVSRDCPGEGRYSSPRHVY